MKFGKVTHIGPLGIVRKNFEFSKIQLGGGRRLENHKNHDRPISATARPIFTKFGIWMQNGSVVVIVNIINIGADSTGATGTSPRYSPGAAIIGGTGGHVPPTFWLGGGT